MFEIDLRLSGFSYGACYKKLKKTGGSRYIY